MRTRLAIQLLSALLALSLTLDSAVGQSTVQTRCLEACGSGKEATENFCGRLSGYPSRVRAACDAIAEQAPSMCGRFCRVFASVFDSILD
ncbi:unnamed protein product [Darwinula stevensoni]|uniref:Uncharacterized protein n=1 Tax=Darwinula stevensoni TaxID=69355 RepID=A0A7R8X954_9CRUS|nr:unnamed protein product [Darwinula stevensoni]CAG0889342.1 unnamed protein product [Darwinula stevensoni]